MPRKPPTSSPANTTPLWPMMRLLIVPIVCVVGEGMADQLAHSITFGDQRQIDLDEINPLGEGDFRVKEA